MFPDLVGCGALAESRHILILTGVFLAPPGVVGDGYLVDLFVGKILVGPVNEASQFAGIDKKGVITAVANLAVLLIASYKPEALCIYAACMGELAVSTPFVLSILLLCEKVLLPRKKKGLVIFNYPL